MASYLRAASLLRNRLRKIIQFLIAQQGNASEHTQSKFAIDSSLLGDPNTLAWSNLGYWQTKHQPPENLQSQHFVALDYISACQQLAHLLGEAAQLNSTDQLLDLGCGQGASLQYWHTAFGVQHITAFEIQAQCIARIKQAAIPPLDAIYQASFSKLPLPNAQLEHAFDAVICVDAAYHAPLNDFIAVNRAVLKPRGRMAFTILIRPVHSKKNGICLSRLTTHFSKGILHLVAVPQQHLHTEQEVIELLSSFNFKDIKINHLDQPVLDGFAQYIKRQPPSLTRYHLTAWLKITLTAKLCAFLYQHQLVHYSVVSATYSPDTTSINSWH